MLSQLQDKFLSSDASRMAIGIFAIALAAVAAVLYQLYSFYQTNSYSPGYKVATHRQQASQIPYQLSDITREHLFGQMLASDSGITQLKLPETRLQLILRGAFTAHDPKLASAIIEGADQQANHYRVNSRVSGNTILHSVFADRIVLSRAGKLETLYFPAPENTTLSTTASSSLNAETVMNAPATANTDVSTITVEQRQALIRERLQQLRNRNRNKN